MIDLHRSTRIALLTTLSLILFLLEGMMPLPLPVPGAKLGLAAIATLIALEVLPHTRDALTVLLLRILLASFLGGGPAPMLYSLAGGLGSFSAMVFLKKHTSLSIISISAAGGFMHNIAQLTVAAIVMQTAALFFYAPVLGLIGTAAGVGIGLLSQSVCQKICR